MTHRPASLLLLLALGGCEPEPGPCDVEAATRPLYYDEGGFPAYPGQALIESSCGSAFYCHAQGIDPSDRFGAPDGLYLDVGVATAPEDFDRLRRARRAAWNLRHDILAQVEAGRMPPGPPAGALDYAPSYRTEDGRALPPIGSLEGIAILRSWLACGAQVIERTEGEPQGIGDLAPRGAGSSCPEGQASCADVCIDVSSDPENCGACGVACGADQSCVDGACVCLNGLDACGTACVDLTSDIANCGACGVSCGARFCSASECADSCGALTDCGGSCVDPSTSLTHCGACGVVCASSEACVAGVCSCASGFTRCERACVDLTADRAHCGACGVTCSGGADCVGGSCACPGGTTRCGDACVETLSDPMNCGGCDVACGAGEGCSSGSCIGCGPSVSFAADVQPIFTTNNRCTASGCHVGSRPAANLTLTVGRAYAELVGPLASCGGGPLVTPGAVDRSYVWNKLNDIDICSGSPMPKRGESLRPEELAIIESWICHGAAND